MASRAVTVLAPNGRRQTVKCTLNTTILQILEDVCKKQGFNSDEYDIKHHNKVMDTSLTVRFSGLPNNAQLELAPTTKIRKESEITVALNLEDGSRVQGTFMPSSTLLDVLNTLYDSQKSNPVVIYMRREIYGEDLSKLDLRSLGLTGGRAMLRVIHKTPEELKTQANISNAIPSKPVVEKPYKRVFQPVEVEEKKYSPSYQNEATTSDNASFKPENKNYSARPDILKLAKGKTTENKVDTSECTPMDVDPPENDNNEESSTVSVGNNDEVTSIEPDEDMKEMKLEDFPFIGERKGLIFFVGTGAPKHIEEPPDDFFDLTINDAKTILRDVRKDAQENEEKPLMTSALRELEESKKQLRHLNKYRKCIIRIQFPDRFILQGVFSPKDSIKIVSDFVKDHLAATDLPFYLYTTPPKNILPEDKMLIEVDCVPVALLHFGVDEKFKNEQTKFIREDLKDMVTTNSLASLAAQMIRKADRVETTESADNPVAGCSTDSNSVSNATKKDSNVTGKVPKWFKT